MATFIAVILSKRVLPGRGRRASCDETAGSTGLGDGVIAGEANGATVLPGRDHTGPLGGLSCSGGRPNLELGGGTADAVPAPYVCYGKPGQGRSATRNKAEDFDGTKSPQKKE